MRYIPSAVATIAHKLPAVCMYLNVFMYLGYGPIHDSYTHQLRTHVGTRLRQFHFIGLIKGNLCLSSSSAT